MHALHRSRLEAEVAAAADGAGVEQGVVTHAAAAAASRTKATIVSDTQ